MDQIIETVLNYLIKLGSIGLMIGIFIDALGVPFPGSLMVIMAGFLIQRGSLNFFDVILAVLIGHLLGTTIAYFIGRHWGQPFFKKYGRYLNITPKKFEKGQHWLEHSAAAFVIGGRFLPTIGNITPYIAGISKLKFMWFLIYSIIFLLLWGTFNITLGFVFSHSWQKASEFIGSKGWIFGVVLMLSYGGYLYYKNKKHKN
ncbi:MAG: DedA family protein [Desulfotomaculum sp.]|nr:DedA family protein [Desulfotomaculum sp.]